VEADLEFSGLLASVSRELLSEPDVQQTLQRAVDLAAHHLDGHLFASVSIVNPRRRVDTPASTDSRAVQADALQYELDEGPCLDAIWEQETFRIDDLAADTRYPRWSTRVSEEIGLGSSLSFQLFTTGDSLGALNLYSATPYAFSEIDVLEGAAFAAQAAVALQAARTEEQLRSALTTRNLIGQAQGILMERYCVSAGQAFEMLRRLSQNSNVKLYEVARQVIGAGSLAKRQPTP
jgi:GAF domain-containing protein